MSRLTIPAGCLAQLGGLVDDDPPHHAKSARKGKPSSEVIWTQERA